MWRDAGALPQTPPEALPLDSARGNCPLTLFSVPGLSAFPGILRESGFYPSTLMRLMRSVTRVVSPRWQHGQVSSIMPL